MRCEEAREQLSAARYGDPLPEAVAAHIASCRACRSAQAAEGELDAWLASDEPAVPRPGFDTRFFARLEQERARGRRWRWARLGFALVPVAAAVALFVLRRPESQTQPPLRAPVAATEVAFAPEVAQEDLDLALDLELIEELEIVQRIDELEAFDALADVDERELEALLEEAP